MVNQRGLIGDKDNKYCIFLHVVEGKNFAIDNNDDDDDLRILLRISLNGIKFEIEGQCGKTTTVFNRNCIWSCMLEDVKRMKTDNRPVKIECFQCYGLSDNRSRILIGTALIPIRGIQPVSNLRNLQLKLLWHKLINLNPKWREKKPEMNLILTIIDKKFLDNGQFLPLLGKRKETHDYALEPIVTETSAMLYSQKNVYIELCNQLGLIQIGNDDSTDCDIFKVSVTFLKLKRLSQLLQQERANSADKSIVCLFKYDFLGCTSQMEITENPDDVQPIKERIALNAKTSMKSLRLYFQRVFYLPISLRFNNQEIGNYRMDFSRYLPNNNFFHDKTFFRKKSCFIFNRNSPTNSNVQMPIVEFDFNIELLTRNSKQMGVPYLPPIKNGLLKKRKLARKSVSQEEISKSIKISDEKHSKSTTLISEQNSVHIVDVHVTDVKVIQSGEELPDVLVTSLLLNGSNYKIDSSDSDEGLELKKPNESISNRSIDEPVRKICKIDNGNDMSPTSIELNDSKESSGFINDIEYESDSKAQETIENDEPDYLTDERNCMTKKVEAELDQWKEEQMEIFLKNLNENEKKAQANRDMLENVLLEKISKCERLNRKLEATYKEVKNVSSDAKQKLETTNGENDAQYYVERFYQLENDVQFLKKNLEEKIKTFGEMQEEKIMENQRLCHENITLKNTIAKLETRLIEMETMKMPAEQTRNILAKLQKKSQQISDLEKYKNYYKEQWYICTREIQKLKALIKKGSKKLDLEYSDNEIEDV